MGNFLALLLCVCVLAVSNAAPSHAFECGLGRLNTKLIAKPFPDPSVFKESGAFYATSTSLDATRLVMRKLSLADTACNPSERVVANYTLRLSYEKLASYDQNFFPKHKSVPLNNVRNWHIWSPSIERNRAGQLRLYATIHFGYFNTAVAVFRPAAGETWSSRSPVRRWMFDKFVAGGGAGGLKSFTAYDFKTEIFGSKRYAIYNYNPNKGAQGRRQSIFIQEIDDRDNLAQARRAKYEFRADPRSEIAWGSLPLVEGGSILAHQGKFFLFYTTGTFLYGDYRIGVAVSSGSILGPYNKMLAGGAISYIMQSRNPSRPGYVGGFFNAPGIPNVIKDANGGLKMVFHANNANERPSQKSCGGNIKGNCFNARQRFAHVLEFDLGGVVFDKGAQRPSGASVELPNIR